MHGSTNTLQIKIFLKCNNIAIFKKNDFADGSKILLDTDLKIILLAHQSNFVGTLKITNNAAKKF